MTFTLPALTDMDKEKQIVKNTVLSLLSEDEVNWQALARQIETLGDLIPKDYRRQDPLACPDQLDR